MRRREFVQLTGGFGAISWFTPTTANSALLKDEKKLGVGQADSGQTSDPITIHPMNPKYFVFRGKPIVLIAATEHYGSVVNRRFDFERYLRAAAKSKQTLTRLFLLYRELQTARNPCSPLKPESPDFVAPYVRTGTGRAMDGEPMFDLDTWNPEYFDRLHKFLSMASGFGIVVELTLFSNNYEDAVWALNPLRDKNNLQGVGKVEWQEYTSCKDEVLVQRQSAYARKIIEETSIYDNVYYEICNEPGGDVPNHVSLADVDAWQEELGRVIRAELSRLNRKHLVVGQNASAGFNVSQYSEGVGNSYFDASFSKSMLDAVNVHPLPNLILRGHTYQLGDFMTKELRLEDFRSFFLAVHSKRKPCISDEDNAASLYCDESGWTLHRKRAWMAVLCGSHYDYIDFSIQVGHEEGTDESRLKIRHWMCNLSQFIHSFDFITAKPAPGWIEAKPQYLIESTLAVPGKDYISYLADSRELTDTTAGQVISGQVAFRLPKGRFDARLYSPRSGEYSPGITVEGGKQIVVEMPSVEQDIVLRVTLAA
jgi:hypothetical protein